MHHFLLMLAHFAREGLARVLGHSLAGKVSWVMLISKSDEYVEV